MKFILLNGAILILASIVISVSTAQAQNWELPVKESPRPKTTTGIPHIQLDVAPVSNLSAQLLEHVKQMPGVELRNTNVGRAGSTGFWVAENTPLARPESIIRGREFAHCHPDGSLHASLPPKLAIQAVEAGWAIHHPWAANKRGLEGFVMIYTPTSEQELEVVVQLVEQSHRYVTERN